MNQFQDGQQLGQQFNNINHIDQSLILWRSSSQWIGGLYFLFFLIVIFSNEKFNYKMISLTHSRDSSYSSKENIKNNIFKIFIYYSILIFGIFLLFNISGVRLFNSLNISMTLISGGGFLPKAMKNHITEYFSKK